MKRIRIDWDRLAPVGLGGRLTVRRICVGLLLVDLYEWIAFTNKFSHYQRMLYQYIPNGGKELLPGAVMAPFYQTLSNNSWGAGISLLMIPLALWHYFYHYQDSRSIYLMRRLPDRRELWRRCLTIPLLGLAACILLYGGNLFIFYAIYESFIPPQCLQPGQWRMLWEYMFH